MNTIFTLPSPYTPGTTAYFLNGQLKEKSLDDGWVELSPSAGTVQLKEPPLPGGLNCPDPDVVQIFYLDTTPSDTIEEVTPIQGLIAFTPELLGLLGGGDEIHGQAEGESLVQGVAVPLMLVVGAADPVTTVRGLVEC